MPLVLTQNLTCVQKYRPGVSFTKTRNATQSNETVVRSVHGSYNGLISRTTHCIALWKTPQGQKTFKIGEKIDMLISRHKEGFPPLSYLQGFFFFNCCRPCTSYGNVLVSYTGSFLLLVLVVDHTPPVEELSSLKQGFPSPNPPPPPPPPPPLVADHYRPPVEEILERQFARQWPTKPIEGTHNNFFFFWTHFTMMPSWLIRGYRIQLEKLHVHLGKQTAEKSCAAWLTSLKQIYSDGIVKTYMDFGLHQYLKIYIILQWR